MVGVLGHFAVIGKNKIQKLPNRKGEGLHTKNAIDSIHFPRKVYYSFVGPDYNYNYPTFIIVNAHYAAVDAIFRALTGKDDASGISDTFHIKQEINYPLRMNAAIFYIEVELVRPHTDFLALKEIPLLLERLLRSHANAFAVERVSVERIYSI